ncbi:MAG: nitroreductase family protein [Erysipelotrichaceae bacterium]|nr:nitroreductase family protein [Erysipelotrichaceae bacterium]
MSSQTIKELVERKSVRVFTKRKISKKNKNIIFEAAINAPTAGNMQLYSIIDVTDNEIKEKLSVYCDNQPFIRDAKMVLVFLADYQKWYEGFKYCGCKPRHPSYGDLQISTVDATIAAQNAVTAAWSLGIGSCYIGDIIERHDDVCKLLNLPNYAIPACMVVFGYPAKKQLLRNKSKRVNLEYTVFENKYHKLSKQDTKKMFIDKAPKGMYESWMKAFYKRKYNSDFSIEMSKSMKKYLKKYDE